LQTRGWEDEEGKRHYRTELVANEMIVLGDRRTIEYNTDDDNEDEGDYAF
jgi:single-strand DNA-binding protein